MLKSHTSVLKSFTGDLSATLSTIHLPIKFGNKEDKYINLKETFYIVDTASLYNIIMSSPWWYAIGVIPSTLYQVI